MNDDKPLYQLEDEEDLPYAYGQEDPNASDDEESIYSDELADGEAEPDDDDAKARKLLSPFSALLRVMFGPVPGWKALKRSRLKPERMGAECFVPMITLAALSELAIRFYDPDVSVMQQVINVIVTFVSYFFGYFMLPLLAAPVLDATARKGLESPFGRNAMMLCFTTLAMFTLISNVFPIFEPVTVFLPLWTIYMIHRLVPVMKVPKDRWAITTVVLAVLVVGLPSVWTWLLSLILP